MDWESGDGEGGRQEEGRERERRRRVVLGTDTRRYVLGTRIGRRGGGGGGGGGRGGGRGGGGRGGRGGRGGGGGGRGREGEEEEGYILKCKRDQKSLAFEITVIIIQLTSSALKHDKSCDS